MQLSTAQLFAEDPILLFKVFDDGALATVDPAGEGQAQELQRRGGHPEHLSCRRRRLDGRATPGQVGEIASRFEDRILAPDVAPGEAWVERKGGEPKNPETR